MAYTDFDISNEAWVQIFDVVLWNRIYTVDFMFIIAEV